MKRNILSVLLVFFVVLSCDKTSIPSSPPEERTIQRFKVAPGESISDKLSGKGLSQRYSCSINTLNREGSAKEFRNVTAVHFFSDEVESAARGQKVRFMFVFTGEPDSNNSWNLDTYNNVVRLAVCDLPDVPGIEQEMKKRLSDFGSDTWVMGSQRQPVFYFNAKRMDTPDIGPI